MNKVVWRFIFILLIILTSKQNILATLASFKGVGLSRTACYGSDRYFYPRAEQFNFEQIIGGGYKRYMMALLNNVCDLREKIHGFSVIAGNNHQIDFLRG